MTMTYLARVSFHSAVTEGISARAPRSSPSHPSCYLPTLHRSVSIFISSSSPQNLPPINILHHPNELCQLGPLCAWLGRLTSFLMCHNVLRIAACFALVFVYALLRRPSVSVYPSCRELSFNCLWFLPHCWNAGVFTLGCRAQIVSPAFFF